VAAQPDRFSRLDVQRFTVEQVTVRRKPSLAFALTGRLLASRFINPVSLAIVVLMQIGLIIPG
jgi:hypothetical protein